MTHCCERNGLNQAQVKNTLVRIGQGRGACLRSTVGRDDGLVAGHGRQLEQLLDDANSLQRRTGRKHRSARTNQSQHTVTAHSQHSHSTATAQSQHSHIGVQAPIRIRQMGGAHNTPCSGEKRPAVLVTFN